MADNSESFDNVSEDRWGKIKDAVKSNAGIEIGSDKGEASKDGVDLGWDYEAEAQTLTVTVVSRAWYDPSVSSILEKLKAWIDGVN